MKLPFAASLLALVALSACGGGGGSDAAYEVSPSPPPPVMSAPAMKRAEMDAFDANGGELEETGGGGNGEPAPQAGVQYIAYSHAIGLRMPVEQVEPMQQGHAAACRAAGPAICIVTGSSFNNQSDDYASASLAIRAKPEWIEDFLGGIDEEAKALKGEVSTRNTWAEDLTRQIIDTDARLQAQRTLQTRLQGLLATRDAQLADLLAIERELARVTGEIESLDSMLKAMRLRVSMSELNIDYQTRVSAVGPQRFNPLGQAFGEFFFNLSSGLAGVITAFAIGLPWLILLGVMLFIWLRLIWPRIRRKKA